MAKQKVLDQLLVRYCTVQKLSFFCSLIGRHNVLVLFCSLIGRHNVLVLSSSLIGRHNVLALSSSLIAWSAVFWFQF